MKKGSHLFGDFKFLKNKKTHFYGFRNEEIILWPPNYSRGVPFDEFLYGRLPSHNPTFNSLQRGLKRRFKVKNGFFRKLYRKLTRFK